MVCVCVCVVDLHFGFLFVYFICWGVELRILDYEHSYNCTILHKISLSFFLLAKVIYFGNSNIKC